MSLANMEKNKSTGFFNVYILGLLVWLIPFVVSFFLYTPQGTPYISVGFFNSMMVITGTLVSAFFLLKYFKGITRNFVNEGVKAGVVWVVMSLVLDLIVLVPFTKMDLGTYFIDIALGYGAILIICVFAGMLLEEKSEHSKKLYSQIFSVKK
ncbi:MAG: hypothetical protein WCI04_01915 [archaeon]